MFLVFFLFFDEIIPRHSEVSRWRWKEKEKIEYRIFDAEIVLFASAERQHFSFLRITFYKQIS